MKSQSDAKSLTVRLRPELYDAMTEAARRRRVSLNALVQQSLMELIRAEEHARLYDGFSLLGEEGEENDVTFALDAQREVVQRGE